MPLTLKINRKIREEWLFFLALGIFLTFTVLSTSLMYSVFHGRPFQIMYIVCVGLLFLRELHGVYQKPRELMGLLIALVLFGIVFLVAKGALQRSISCIFLFIYCSRKIPFTRIARFTLYLTGMLVLFVMFCGYAGIIENHVVIQKNRVREYLGFRYALFPSAHLLNLTSLWLWLNRKKVPLTGVALWGAVNVWMFLKTDSRFSFVISLGLLLAAVVLRFFPRILDRLKLFRWCMAFSFPACAALSIYLTVIFDRKVPWLAKLNSALSGRLRLGQDSLRKYGIKLFGQNLTYVGNGLDAHGQQTEGVYDYVDCMYIRVLQNFGPVFFVLFLVLVTWAMIRCVKKREDLLLVIMTTVAAHCMIDDLSMYLYYNTFWLAMGGILMNREYLAPYRKEPQPGRQRLRFRLR